MERLYENQKLTVVFTKATVGPYRQPIQSPHFPKLHSNIILHLRPSPPKWSLTMRSTFLIFFTQWP
jgi:hypothetical protein